jgi:hypothetical protein
VARSPETIQREIEQARTALAVNLDTLSQRADPRRIADAGRQSVEVRMADPRVRYGLIGVGALVVLIVLRKLFR